MSKMSNKTKIRVPFEEMPKELSMSMSLSDVSNPKPNSMMEFTALWMEIVGTKEYLKQLNKYQWKK